MNSSNKTKIFSMLLVGAILVAGTISTMIPATSFAQSQYTYVPQQEYTGYENSYGNGYDKKQATDLNIQKVKCNNIIINGVDKSSPTTGDMTGNTMAADEENDGTGQQQSQGFANGKQKPKDIKNNIANICVNKNILVAAEVPPVVNQDCEDCFSSLDEQVINRFLMTVDAILNSLQVDAQINTLEDLCNFLETSTQISSVEKWQLLSTALGSESLPRPTIDNILQCLEDLGIIVEPA
ncbi:MAG: hypothetical protein MRJ93_11235 [Nitrososphaeraceae archaeon]|nr:hypothetical protein [Nitrososphaeraceae archaeon]